MHFLSINIKNLKYINIWFRECFKHDRMKISNIVPTEQWSSSYLILGIPNLVNNVLNADITNMF